MIVPPTAQSMKLIHQTIRDYTEENGRGPEVIRTACDIRESIAPLFGRCAIEIMGVPVFTDIGLPAGSVQPADTAP